MPQRLLLPTEPKENINNETNTSYKQILMRFVRFWPFLFLGIVFAVGIALFYIRNSTPVYKVSSSIILKDARSEYKRGADHLDFALSGASNNVANELFILRSRTLIRKVLERLNLNTLYIVEKKGRIYDLYKNSPIIIAMDKANVDTLSRGISLQLEILEDNSISVKGLSEWITADTIFRSLPALLPTPSGNVSITKREGTVSHEKFIRAEIYNPDVMARRYRSALSIVPPSQFALVLDLTFHTPFTDKGIDFLNTLIEVYNNETIEENRREMINTQSFINDRIRIINEELVEVEQDVESFKQTRGLTDIRSDLHRDIRVGDKYEEQLVQVETQLNIVKTLSNYLEDPNNNNKTIPGNIGISNPMLVTNISEYNRLILESEQLSQRVTGDNPAMIRLNEQIAGLHNNIQTSIRSVVQGLNIQRRDARNQVDLYGMRLSSLPTKEREYLELSREQHVKSQLFLSLLQKREENALLLAANANSAKILDEAMVEGKVSPRSLILILVSIILGLLIPAAIIYIVDMIRFKIHNRAEVDRISEISLLSEIPRSRTNEHIAVKAGKNDEIDEAFRIMRTNLLLSLGSNKKVVTFTSTVPGEGKTFIAINSALSTAMLDKKVLLVGMDLRSPKLSEYLGVDNKNGLTLYLSGFEKNINRLIVPSDIQPNLFVLPSGPVPPNPSELLTRPILDELFDKLSEDYDYIYIDSAPTAPVTDTTIMNRISDATVYVCRIDYSSKENLRFANELQKKGRLSNMLLVINDTKEYQLKYGYGYGNEKLKRKETITN